MYSKKNRDITLSVVSVGVTWQNA